MLKKHILEVGKEKQINAYMFEYEYVFLDYVI